MSYMQEANAIADIFRARLLKQEAKEFFLLIKQWESIQTELLVMIQKIVDKEIKSPDELFRLGLYQRFEDDAKAKILEYSKIAGGGVLSDGQKQSGLMGIKSTEKMIELKTEFFNKLNPKVINEFIGKSFYDGAKLDSTLFMRTYPAYVETVKTRLLEGISLGRGPRETASLITKDTGALSWQSLRLARTENLSLYRTTGTMSMKESGVVKEKMRVEEDDACDICQDENGKTYDLDEDVDFHPNCRGSFVAVL